jgi:hypothetical protein
VHALDLAEHLVLLEDALRGMREEEGIRLFSAISPMIDDLAAAARVAALSGSV